MLYFFGIYSSISKGNFILTFQKIALINNVKYSILFSVVNSSTSTSRKWLNEVINRIDDERKEGLIKLYLKLESCKDCRHFLSCQV